MAGLFGFGAFSTQIGQMIGTLIYRNSWYLVCYNILEQATDNSASAGNMGLHLQICDAIVAADNG